MPKHLVHAHSVVVNEGNPKLPAASRIEYGEIAVNYAEGYETLSIKNSNDDIVTFSSDEAIKKIIIDNEQVIANSLNDLDERVTATNESITEIQALIDDDEEITANALTDLDERLKTSEDFISDFSDNETIVANAISDLDERVDVNSSLIAQLFTDAETNAKEIESITYANLKSKRNGGTLKPGQLYRITDYQTTTTQTNTQSANHSFDIIVLATDVDALSEDAKAVKHSGDTYFSEANLNAWQLKYSLDNDTDKYGWADATNGKGVIYYMKDEWNNECYYDFKNIQFRRWNMTNIELLDDNLSETAHTTLGWLNRNQQVDLLTAKTRYCHTNSLYNFDHYDSDGDLYGNYTFNIESNNNKPYYTFSTMELDMNTNNVSDVIEDITVKSLNSYSITDYMSCCANNIIKPYFKIVEGKHIQVLNNIVFNGLYSNTELLTVSISCYGNTMEEDCRDLTFGCNCCMNQLGKNVSTGIFANLGSSYNVIGNNTRSFTLDSSSNNVIGANTVSNFLTTCNNNTLENNANYNVLDSACQYNLLESFTVGNTLYFDCDNNKICTGATNNFLGARSKYNNLLVGVYQNTLGEGCEHNTISNDYNTLGEDCKYNTIYGSSNVLANHCNYNNLEPNANSITFDKDYTNNVVVERNSDITLTSTLTTSSSQNIRNVKIESGITQGTTITHDAIPSNNPYVYQNSNRMVVSL